MLAAQARQLSPHTLSDYSNTYRRLRASLGGDPALADIDRAALVRFLAGLQVGGLSKKTVLNYHVGLSALWQWAADEGIVTQNIVRSIRPPKPDVRAIEPFTRSDVEAVLETAGRSRMGKRNAAVVLVLLDTCIRASELCALAVGDCDLSNRRLRILRGKGGKERYVSCVAETARAVWRYLTARGEVLPDDPLFATQSGGRLSRTELAHILKRIGRRAGVAHVHAHRFRHTGAVQHLVNGMPAPVLQDMLGHASLDMTRRYLNLAGLDVAKIHARSSPVVNWKL